jgi:hypothetical protein
MTMRILKIEAAMFPVVVVGGNVWLASLRCSTSPHIDWSLLAFGWLLQAAIVAFPFVMIRFADLADNRARLFALAAVPVLLVSFPAVWIPMLLSDTITNKFYHSGAYDCPGMWSAPQ